MSWNSVRQRRRHGCPALASIGTYRTYIVLYHLIPRMPYPYLGISQAVLLALSQITPGGGRAGAKNSWVMKSTNSEASIVLLRSMS